MITAKISKTQMEVLRRLATGGYIEHYINNGSVCSYLINGNVSERMKGGTYDNLLNRRAIVAIGIASTGTNSVTVTMGITDTGRALVEQEAAKEVE